MSIVSPARIRLLLPLLLTMLTVLSVAVLSIGVAPPGSAAPAPLRAGTGYRLAGGDFVGFYRTRAGVEVYCIDPGKRAPTAVSLTSISRYRGMSRRTAAELAYALSAWGKATSRTQAAAESQLVNTIVGHSAAVHRRAAHLPRAVARLLAAHLRTVHTRSGPYTLRLRTPRAAAPGQTATGSAAVTSATGTGLPGVPIRLRGGTNVRVPATVRTGARGTVSFRYTVTATGPVRITATAAGLAPPRFIGTHPAAGRQRMVTWSRTVGASAQAGFQARPGTFSHTYACGTACDGHPRVTVRACAAASAYASRLAVRTPAAAVGVLTFPASTRSSCRSVAVVLADRDRVTATWSFRGPHGWTTPAAAGGSFVIDCPAVPPVQVSLGYDCVRGSFAAAVTAPAGHPVVLVIAGAVRQRIPAAGGATARFTAPVRCGTVQTYTVQAGVGRSGGGWNYGPAARISTPGPARQP